MPIASYHVISFNKQLIYGEIFWQVGFNDIGYPLLVVQKIAITYLVSKSDGKAGSARQKTDGEKPKWKR